MLIRLLRYCTSRPNEVVVVVKEVGSHLEKPPQLGDSRRCYTANFTVSQSLI